MEAIAILVVGVFLAFFFLPPGIQNRGKHPRIKCVHNLKNIGLAARIYAYDNNGKFPGAQLAASQLSRFTAADYFRMLSNYLSEPKVILCPSDRERENAASFPLMQNKNISYFANLSARPDSTNTFLSGDRNLLLNGKQLGKGITRFTTDADLGWSSGLHNGAGNIAMADGSVNQFSPERLTQAMAGSELHTNVIVIP